jgi:hypothetical protein
MFPLAERADYYGEPPPIPHLEQVYTCGGWESRGKFGVRNSECGMVQVGIESFAWRKSKRVGTYTVNDPQRVERLMGSFPELETDRIEERGGSWLPSGTVKFVRTDGSQKTVEFWTVSVSH